MRTVLFRAKPGSYKTWQGTVPLMMVEGYQVSAAGPKISGITISELNLPLNPFGRDNELGN